MKTDYVFLVSGFILNWAGGRACIPDFPFSKLGVKDINVFHTGFNLGHLNSGFIYVPRVFKVG